MHKLKNGNIPKIFSELIKKPKHKYPTKFLRKQLYHKIILSPSNMKYCISVRGPKLWNYFLRNEEKEIQSSLPQNTVKSKLIKTENKVRCFCHYFSNFLFLILILLILISQSCKWELGSRS